MTLWDYLLACTFWQWLGTITLVGVSGVGLSRIILALKSEKT